MNTVRTIGEMRAALERARARGRLGLVPTMGALHDGHLACFRAARAACEHLVATIFINPIQFGDPSDLAAYPRHEARDAELASAAGVDTLFIPSLEEMYAADHATFVDVAGAALGFEGAHRPGHFRGVATICLKLFSIVRPDVAFFGQKDAQQLAVIRQIVRDLNVGCEVHAVPTVRDADGLALSSRNVRLSSDERHRALAIPQALADGLAAYRAGGDPAAAARARLDGLDVDYVGIASFDRHLTLVVAARAGRTRLIDNVPLDCPELGGL